MSRHELEARLKQVREEIAAIQDQVRKATDGLKADTRAMEERTARMETRHRARREAEEAQRSTVWGKTKLFFGVRDEPKLPKDYGRGDGIDTFFDVMKAAALLPLGLEAKKRLEELQQEEGRILDQLDKLGPQQKKEQTKAEQREKIYEEMAQRKAEWERVRSRESDQERLIRLKNIFDDAEARDEDRLRKLL